MFDTLKLRASYGELGNQEIGISNADINISNINEFTGAYAYGGSCLLYTSPSPRD